LHFFNCLKKAKIKYLLRPDLNFY